MNIKAIETRYRGCLFRSRLEARYAVFFDALGESWQYEREGYELPDGRYLPDFWLDRLKIWVEIKPAAPKRNEELLCEQLALGSDCPVAIACGLPTPFPGCLRVFCWDLAESSGGCMWWPDASWCLDDDSRLAVSVNERDRVFTDANWEVATGILPCGAMLPERFCAAASTARFEHLDAN